MIVKSGVVLVNTGLLSTRKAYHSPTLSNLTVRIRPILMRHSPIAFSEILRLRAAQNNIRKPENQLEWRHRTTPAIRHEHCSFA